MVQFILNLTFTGRQTSDQRVVYNDTMNKTRFRIMPEEHYVVKVGNHNEEIMGKDVLAILEAAFDEAAEIEAMTDVRDKMEEIDDLDS